MPKFVQFAETEGVSAILTAEVTLPEDMPQSMRDDATNRISYLLRREAQRVAEICLVDAIDAQAWPAERERIRNADPNRGHVVVQAGTRELVKSGKVDVADAVTVLKGSIEAHGQTLTAEKGN